MKISGNQTPPLHERLPGAQQARQATPSATRQPDAPAPTPTMEEQFAKSVQKVGSRIAAAVDSGSLTTRQAQALSEVQQDFEQQMGRLASALHGDGASRHELNDGMSKIYDNLRESLSAILTSGTATPFDDNGGVAFDQTV